MTAALSGALAQFTGGPASHTGRRWRANGGAEAAPASLTISGGRPADRDGLAPLHYALRKGFTYLKAGQRDDHYGQIGLPYLFRDDMTRLVKTLLEHGANPNTRISRGKEATPTGTDSLPDDGGPERSSAFPR